MSPVCDSALARQILCKLDDRLRSYDVILILQHGGHSVANEWPPLFVCSKHVKKKFWMHQDVKYNFAANLTESATNQYINRPKWIVVFVIQ